MIGENNWQAYTRISNIKIIGSRRGFSRDDGLHALRRMIEIIYALAECIRRNFLDGSHCIHGALFFFAALFLPSASLIAPIAAPARKS